MCNLGHTEKNQAVEVSDYIFDFFSATAKQNSTELDKKLDLNLLPSLFLGRFENQDCHPGIWLTETFSISLQSLNKIMWQLKEPYDLNILYQVYAFPAYWKT